MILDVKNVSFAKLYEIELTAEPQQDFSFTINDTNFDIEMQTFASGETRLNIYIDGNLAINYAPIDMIMCNLLFYTTHSTGALFFASDADDLNGLSYADFGNRLRLYYGYF